MYSPVLAFIGIPELGMIAGIAVILFGCKAVSQNPFIDRKQKLLWMLVALDVDDCSPELDWSAVVLLCFLYEE